MVLGIDPLNFQSKRVRNPFDDDNSDGDADLCSWVYYALINLVGEEEGSGL